MARENNVKSSFFNLDKPQAKLKRADWLQYVRMEGVISEAVKRQSHYLNQISQYDSLLESAFNLIDVNDASSVNRILEDASAAHVERAQHRNQTKVESSVDEDLELEQNLKTALLKSEKAKLEEIQKQ